ncbi:MAG: RNA methyltransferase [Candidatus Fermentibacteraceae bacterium]|nr:RNA methyltransferase [Candidatus Fermentibacteraceae bacterium]MBN2608473.1 RNA methyltransferase [Candidatus Fermentibacteraceae bacterium]
MIISVTSPANQRLKVSRQLHSRSAILKNGLFLMEGPKFVSDQLERSLPEWILLSVDAGEEVRGLAGRIVSLGVDVLELPAGLFKSVSDTETSQGIISVLSLPAADVQILPRRGFFLLLDGVSDPGNMGTILRSAAAFGCAAVITGPGSCFPFIPKVTRAAAGLNGSITLACDVDLPGFMRENGSEMEFAGADTEGDDPGTLRGRRDCLGLVIGSEAHGISGPVEALLDFKVAIPMTGGVESLNAAVSASILLYEASRGNAGV